MFESPLNSSTTDADVIVVGGGLTGLIAGTKIALAGRSVLVLEQGKHLGGRAATNVKNGRHLNLGPHALYCGGHAFRLLQELQVPFSGNFPNSGKSVLLQGRTEYAFPAGPWSLLTSGMLTLREKWVTSRLFQKLPQLPTKHLDHVSLAAWIEREAGTDNLAAFLKTLFRLNTFIADAEQLSAATAIEQFQMGLAKNVWYLDGGWQTLIDGLRGRARDAGVQFRSSSSVKRIQCSKSDVAVTLASGDTLHGRAVVVAVPPATACQILELPEEAALSRWTTQAISVRAACLDVCLNRLTRPEHRFALGLDRSVYYSVHSAAARLAPDGIAVVHVMKYLRDRDEQSSVATEAELECVLDQLQPGWRAHAVERRFLPNMTVSYCLPTAAGGGLSGRPPVAVENRPGVFLAGDWIGARGLLADASAASAEEAANCVLSFLQKLGDIHQVIWSEMHVGT